MTKFEKFAFVIFSILVVINIMLILQDLVYPQTIAEAASVYWFKGIHRFQNFDDEKIENLHAKAEKLSSNECISCHGVKAITKRTDTIHSIHLPSPEFDFECTDCHVRIAMGPIVSEDPKEKVNIERCAKCHESKKNVANVPNVPENHSDENWTNKLHGKSALELGEGFCYKCHEHGLDYCESCHLLRPNTHLTDWKITHKTNAETDSENCYYCHKVSFCKQCHIKHTGDWVKQHKSTVQVKGLNDCLHCHIMNFCTDCHVK